MAVLCCVKVRDREHLPGDGALRVPDEQVRVLRRAGRDEHAARQHQRLLRAHDGHLARLGLGPLRRLQLRRTSSRICIGSLLPLPPYAVTIVSIIYLLLEREIHSPPGPTAQFDSHRLVRLSGACCCSALLCFD